MPGEKIPYREQAWLRDYGAYKLVSLPTCGIMVRASFNENKLVGAVGVDSGTGARLVCEVTRIEGLELARMLSEVFNGTGHQ